MLNKIGIIGAMEEEVELLIDAIEIDDAVAKAGMVYYMGKLCGKEVVIVECGIGKINAAVCTQVLISEFKVDTVINTGVAGSLRNSLNIGDYASAKISSQEDVIIQGTKHAIYMNTPVHNTNEDLFVAGDGGGILIKKPGTYLVRVRLHVFQNANEAFNVGLIRYLDYENDIASVTTTVVPAVYSVQTYVDFVTVIYHSEDRNDRVVPAVDSLVIGGSSAVFGTNTADDSMISVTKIG